MQQQTVPIIPVGDRTIQMSYEDYCKLDYEHGLTEWVEGEALLDFSTLDDVHTWLHTHAMC